MQYFIISLLLFFQQPQPNGYVTDNVGLLSDQMEQTLENKLSGYEDKTGIEIALLIHELPAGENEFNYSLNLAESWGVGKDGVDNGLFIYVAPEDRVIRVHTGYGLEPFITDYHVNRVIGDNEFKGLMRSEDYDAALSMIINKFIMILGDMAEEDRAVMADQIRAEREAQAKVVFKGFLWVLGLFVFGVLAFLGYSRYQKNQEEKRKKKEKFDYKTSLYEKLLSIVSEYVDAGFTKLKITKTTLTGIIDDRKEGKDEKFKVTIEDSKQFDLIRIIEILTYGKKHILDSNRAFLSVQLPPLVTTPYDKGELHERHIKLSDKKAWIDAFDKDSLLKRSLKILDVCKEIKLFQNAVESYNQQVREFEERKSYYSSLERNVRWVIEERIPKLIKQLAKENKSSAGSFTSSHKKLQETYHLYLESIASKGKKSSISFSTSALKGDSNLHPLVLFMLNAESLANRIEDKEAHYRNLRIEEERRKRRKKEEEERRKRRKRSSYSSNSSGYPSSSRSSGSSGSGFGGFGGGSFGGGGGRSSW